MEALGAFSDGEWDSFTAMFSCQELEQPPFPMAEEHHNNNNNNNAAFSTEVHNSNSSWFYSLDAFDPNLQSDMSLSLSCSSCSTDNSSGSGNGNGDPSFLFPNSSTHDLFVSIDDETNFGSSFLSDVLIGELKVDKAALAAAAAACDGLQIPPPPADEPIALKRKVNDRDFSHNQKMKKTRISGHGQKRKKPHKGKCVSVEEEDNAAAAEAEGQSSVSYSSDEENGGGGATTSDGGVSGKTTRASRGSATDPQSLYARKRRERINERLKILQKLVPNGTKVDISTMLEEAVHYVKFLQLQIKLLSSDEMWMFAPLAYNGMDLGLHQKLSPFISH